MRKMIVAAVALGALSGCAGTPAMDRQAALQCQMVGIASNDPAFNVCMKSYTQQSREQALQDNYKVLNSVGTQARSSHVDPVRTIN